MHFFGGKRCTENKSIMMKEEHEHIHSVVHRHTILIFSKTFVYFLKFSYKIHVNKYKQENTVFYNEFISKQCRAITKISNENKVIMKATFSYVKTNEQSALVFWKT